MFGALTNHLEETMRKSFLFLGLVALCLSASSSAQAQIFQNTNSSCENEQVLNTATNTDSTISIACRNYKEDANFNSDNFVDCAAAVGDAISTPEEIISVLMNKGSSATSCASGTGDQFDTPLNYLLGGVTNRGVLSNIVVGSLNPTSSPFSDLAVALVEGGRGGASHISSAYSQSGGGFGADGSDLGSNNAIWQTAITQRGVQSNQAQRSLALMDCNGDGLMDSVTAVIDSGNFDQVFLNVNVNGGSGLVDITGASASFATGIVGTVDKGNTAVVSVGDFNGDGSPDIAVLGSMGVGLANTHETLEICVNNGACSFTCTNANGINIEAAHSNVPIGARSMVAGFFNDDDILDVAITEPNLALGSRGIHYYFGNGDGTFAAGGSHVSFPSATGLGNDADPRVITAGCFNNDNQTDTATTYETSFSGTAFTQRGDVQVVTSDGAGGLNAPVALTINPPAGFGSIDVSGIAAADFDNQGGDDIIALASSTNGNPRTDAYIFMNALETIVANAGADITSDNEAVTLSGSCAVNPADATAKFATTWEIVTPKSGATLTNATTLTPTLTASVPGTYTLRLTCRTRCKDVATDTVNVTVGELLLEGDGRLGHPGCMLNPLAPVSFSGIVMMFSGLGVLWSVRRKRK